MSLLLQRGSFACKSTLPSPLCRILHNGIDGLNAVTAIFDAHTQHARKPTGVHRLTHKAKSHYLCCPFLSLSFFPFLLPLYPPHVFKSPDFSPLFCLSFFSDVFWHSNPSLAFFQFWQRSSSTNWLLLASIATAPPVHPIFYLSSRNSLNPGRPLEPPGYPSSQKKSSYIRVLVAPEQRFLLPCNALKRYILKT